MRVHIYCQDSAITEFMDSGFSSYDFHYNYNGNVPEVRAGDILVADLAAPASCLQNIFSTAGHGPIVVMTNTRLPEDDEPAHPVHAIRVAKPFCRSELRHALERAAGLLPASTLSVGPLEMNLATGHTTREGDPLRLYPQGRLLLEALMRAPEQIVSRDDILKNYFDYTARLRPNLVDVLISRLRTSLDKNYATPLLHTVRGKGYMLKID